MNYFSGNFDVSEEKKPLILTPENIVETSVLLIYT